VIDAEAILLTGLILGVTMFMITLFLWGVILILAFVDKKKGGSDCARVDIVVRGPVEDRHE